jgi:predicted O-linked N-acetylglucosamine transferase (SPINDLY family)
MASAFFSFPGFLAVATVAEAYALALQHHQAGQLRQAEHLYRQILQADPGHAEAYQLLGVIAYQMGSFGQAIALIGHAISLNPLIPGYYSNLGAAQEALGRLNEAMASYEQAIRLHPDHAEAHHNVANLLLSNGQPEQAARHYEQAIRIRPDYAEAHHGLATAIYGLGKLDEAVAHFQHALRHRPEYPEAQNGLGNALQSQGRLDAAVAHYQLALHSRTDYADAHNGLGNALASQGKLDEAVAQYRLALRCRPNYAEAHNGLGNVLGRQDKIDEAIADCREALRLKPDFAEAYFNLGNALERQDKLDDVVSCFRHALHFKPRFAEALNNLGSILLRQGQVDQAVGCFRQALQLQPHLTNAQSNLLFGLNYDSQADPDSVFEEHRRWGKEQTAANSAELEGRGRSQAQCDDPDRRLRIGYVSPDLRHHALMRYLEPVLTHHDPRQVEVYCYAEVSRPDSVTNHLRSIVPNWRSTVGQTDAEIAARIRNDQIDILVDLAGHTAGNRLPVFARKPAKIQATWLGYLNTTGLDTVDYRLTDDGLDPPDQPPRDTEELFRLTGGMCCFAPPEDAPAVAPLPATRRGYLTFGSLCSLQKLNPQVFDLWSQVLKAVPESRLLLFHHHLTASASARIRQEFIERGVASERLDLRQGSYGPGYLRVYEEIDVTLDTFPYTGGVTTCESLWMGVPVLTLLGQRPAGRNAAALLARVGLPEWVAQSPEQFVATAVGVAKDIDGLVQLRLGLRDRVRATLCDAERFTRTLEDAFRSIWHRWCADAKNNRGNELLRQNHLDEALSCYQEAVNLNPTHAEAHYNWANALQRQNRVEEAIQHLRGALQHNPKFAQACNNLGNALTHQGNLVEAISYLEQAVRLDPTYAEAHNNLAIALALQDRHDEAIGCYRQALALKPDFAEAYNNLAGLLLGQGQLDEAIANFQLALHYQPNLTTAHNNLLFCLNHQPHADQDAVFEEHRRWGQLQEGKHSAKREVCGSYDGPRDDPERRLRIGYVSPDLRQHALLRYFEPVLAHHDPAQVEAFCYAEVPVPDAATARLQRLAHGWRSTCGLADDQVAEHIRNDRIDILVDLAGHTGNSRLSVFARKPAPVQVTWLGYLNTTGLTSVDYRLTDSVLDPPGQPIRDTEELIRLPRGMCCFLPPNDAPDIADLPALDRGSLTFGSLHNVFKINADVFDLWARVLQSVPDARLLMFRDNLTTTAQQHIRQQFANRGIAAERLDLRRGSSAPGYLKVCAEIDVNLDVFPWSGGVTTCESLWMGVPVLTLCGDRPASRNSASILARAGLNDWVAQSAEEYVALAARLPRELDRLAQLRFDLRDRMRTTLCDAGTFTRELEKAYRAMWRRWCSRQLH